MKQISGTYSEIELVKSDSDRDQATAAHGTGVKLNSREWDGAVEQMHDNVRR